MLRLFEEIFDIVFPRYCVICGELGKVICTNCENSLTLQYWKRNLVLRQRDKSLPLQYGFSHTGSIKKLIHLLKYEFITELVPTLTHIGFQFPPNGVLVPVPLHSKKLRMRGFNQAELIANELLILYPSLSLWTGLKRIKNTKPQITLHKSHRLTNTIGAFACNSSPPQSVILIDDVATTGSTLLACADALQSAGALEISALAIAHGDSLDR